MQINTVDKTRLMIPPFWRCYQRSGITSLVSIHLIEKVSQEEHAKVLGYQEFFAFSDATPEFSLRAGSYRFVFRKGLLNHVPHHASGNAVCP